MTDELFRILREGDDQDLHDFMKKEFGPNGNTSIAHAENEGNAMFEEFLSEMALVPESNPFKKDILGKANARRYHDFEGDLMKLGMVRDLTQAGLLELAKRTRNGDFDF